jgi:hypothetical protein
MQLKSMNKLCHATYMYMYVWEIDYVVSMYPNCPCILYVLKSIQNHTIVLVHVGNEVFVVLLIICNSDFNLSFHSDWELLECLSLPRLSLRECMQPLNFIDYYIIERKMVEILMLRVRHGYW